MEFWQYINHHSSGYIGHISFVDELDVANGLY